MYFTKLSIRPSLYTIFNNRNYMVIDQAGEYFSATHEAPTMCNVSDHSICIVSHI